MKDFLKNFYSPFFIHFFFSVLVLFTLYFVCRLFLFLFFIKFLFYLQILFLSFFHSLFSLSLFFPFLSFFLLAKLDMLLCKLKRQYSHINILSLFHSVCNIYNMLTVSPAMVKISPHHKKGVFWL